LNGTIFYNTSGKQGNLKSLKILKGLSETVIRMTDNIMGKTLHRKLKIELSEPTCGVNTSPLKEYAILAPHVTPVVALLLRIW